jgi:hypothetical protein
MLAELELKRDRHQDLFAARKEKKAHAAALTLSKWAAIYQKLPEATPKRSAGRDIQIAKHLLRHLGNKLLGEINRRPVRIHRKAPR